MARPDQFLVFDTTVRRHGREWRWFVSTTEGVVVMCGSERRRSAATYQASRALFLLLSAGPRRMLGPASLITDGHGATKSRAELTVLTCLTPVVLMRDQVVGEPWRGPLCQARSGW